MRLNRKIRIGAALVALALLLLGLVTISRRLQPDATPTPVANAASTPDPGNSVAAAPSSNRIARARQNIPERSIVTPEMLEYREARAGEDGRAFVTDPNAQAVGFITQRPIAAGADVRRADLLGHISDVGVAGALLPGRRAMILPIGGKSTLHDLVRIGDRVDIVASFEQQESRVVAEDVRVLAVDVFGSDYPQVKIAMRGDYKAPAHAYSAAVPPSPSGAAGQPGASNAANPDAPAGQQPAAGAPAGATGPEPTPTQGPPPARPESALTIEVTPQQATDISLTQAAGQNLDFLLRARSEPRIPAGIVGVPGAGGITLASGETRTTTAFSIRDRLAPYAARAKRSGAASANAARNAPVKELSGALGKLADAAKAEARAGGNSRFNPPDIPPPTQNVPPFDPSKGIPLGGPSAPAPPATYDIPVYGDGKLVRTDTVRRPPSNR